MSVPDTITGKIFMQCVSDMDMKTLKSFSPRFPLEPEVVNFQNNSQMTPLMVASQKPKDRDCVNLIELIFRSGNIDVNLTNRDGYSALHFAARKGHYETVKVLLEKDCDFTIVSTGSEKVTAMEITSNQKVRELLSSANELKEERERMKLVTENGLVVYTSVLKGDLRGVVRVTEKKNVSVDTYSYKPNKNDHFPLRNAIDLCHFDIFKVLLEQDVEKDLIDNQGRNYLMHICSLKRAGSYPNTKFSRDRENLRMSMLTTLVEIGTTSKTMLERRDNDGNSSLHIACENGYIEDIKLLIDLEVDVNMRQISNYPYRGYPKQREKDGDTAFILTCRKRSGYQGNYMEILETLYYYGKCDINMRGTDGMTALMWAVWNEDLPLVEWLIEEGANINEQSNFGATALMWSIEHLRLDAAVFLLNFSMEELKLKKEAELEEEMRRKEEEEEERKVRKKKVGNDIGNTAKNATSTNRSKSEKPNAKKGKSSSRKSKISADLLSKMKDDKNVRYPRMLGYYR